MRTKVIKSFLQVNGESVEENANLVIRLLIRRPECLGPALRGEGEGLLRAIIDANKVNNLTVLIRPNVFNFILIILDV